MEFLKPAEPARIALVDLLRGVALVAMTGFHFCFDLGMFGLIDPLAMFEPFPVWTARSIAGTFLFLVGFSLYLAHGRRISWAGFLKRLGQVGGAAAIISGATWFATPDAFIFFGILHSIAFASLAGLLFLALPWQANAAAGLFVLVSRPWLQSTALDDPLWWWSGLSRVIPHTNDYVPVFPFFGMVLLGIAAAQYLRGQNLMACISALKLENPAARLLRLLGRNSLVYYLLHQPVMLGILYGILKLSGRI